MIINTNNSSPIIGIYKITSPSHKIYIGQSINIYKRWNLNYKHMISMGQSPLYKSFKKYGWENHKFEIKEECLIEQLNERERYWQDFYDVLGPKGLNCILTKTKDRSGNISEETKIKIGEKSKRSYKK